MKVILDNLAAANPAKANPTVTATAASSVASGGLAAGTYFASYSWVDPFGETLAGGRSAQFTSTGLAQLWTLTIPALPTGVLFANVYVTPTNGAAGTEQLYASGVTTTTFALSYAPKVDTPSGMPALNTTGCGVGLNMQSGAFYSLTNHNPEVFLAGQNQWMSSLLRGDPMSERDVRVELNSYAGILAAWAQAAKEAATLAWTNLGTVGYTTQGAGVGMSSGRRNLA